jgi:hypothetical protein
MPVDKGLKVNLMILSDNYRVSAKKVLISFLLGLVLPAEMFAQSIYRPQRPRQYQSARQSMSSQSNSIEFDISYKIMAPGKTRRIKFIVQLPQTIPGRQTIVNIESTPEPQRTFQKNGNTYAEYSFNNYEKELSIDIVIEAELFKFDLATAIKNPQNDSLSGSELAEFLKQEEYIEINNPSIQKAARSIGGYTELDIVRNIFNYVLDNLEYVKLSGKGVGAAASLRYHKGDCTEYSDLFVALCRAKDIPARAVTGYVIGTNETPLRHNWAEVYLKDYGWIPFELSGSDVRYLNIRDRMFSQLMPRYMSISYIRNDNVLRNYSFCVVSYQGDKVRMSTKLSYK